MPSPLSVRSRFVRTFVVTFCFLLFSLELYAAQLEREVVTVAYVLSFAKNIEWPGEDRISKFNFLVISDDSGINREMKAMAASRELKGRPIEVTLSESVVVPDDVHLIFITRGLKDLTAPVFDRIQDKGKLLVSDGFDDQRSVMINLIEDEDQTVKFEINKANIINQGLKVLPDMVLLGGTEIDVAELYRESQDSLRKKEDEVKALQENLDTLNESLRIKEGEVEALQRDLDSLNAQVAAAHEEIEKKQLQISRQNREIFEQRTQIEEEQRELERLSNSVRTQQETLVRQGELLEQSRNDLERQQGEIENRKAVLLEQKEVIERQKDSIVQQSRVLEEQGATIAIQKHIQYFLIVVVLLVLGLSYIIYRSYKANQIANRKLQGQTEELQVMLTSLELERNKSQQYLDIAGVIMVAIDADRKVTLINQKGCDVLGVTAEGVIGEDWFETFVPESVRSEVVDHFCGQMVGEVEQSEYFESKIVTRQGDERLIAWQNVLLRDDAGNVSGRLSSGEDITGRKRAEEQIKRLNRDLQERAVALESANKDLEGFSYSVSHDLRAPLRHIDGFMEMLQERNAGSLDEKSIHYMVTIRDSAKRMGLLIDDLLAFSRTGRQALSKRRIDLKAKIESIVRAFEQETSGRTVEWKILDLPEVSADSTLMQAVLENLVGNAIKFTRSREVAKIEIGGYENSGEKVVFVRDNGVGFDMEYVDKLFGVFQRLHQADEFEGTGIGLANVHRIISRHGGRVWAEGGLDRGATFYFSLPAVD
ncbi:YfiR/HmsC family protein [Pelagicoccus sp. SDUM812003]|uniref:YfiR/HmsC family protein n=1 Tax=Pelagicoccus sp. SDUM812003 TaxID=3041267 RepID=UPI002810805A|nr:YfiR/HmsC family protein [Pelagicoccus sp. SDUM812003]MDQ8202156.1 YfiR/HmsC family protein [Pelagicoccus sp. SDUM812003]